MKILYVNGTNAKKFDKQVDNNITFAKYFSPSCPACIGMKDEWIDMCKDIDQKYNTDLILAEIDPDGMTGLENTHTYNDVDYVPHIVILENGKKIKEYNGPKTKDNMIEFLLQGGYLQRKMNGGSKKSKKSKKQKNRKKGRTYKKGGMRGVESDRKARSSRFSEDFSFVEGKYWLKPFLTALVEESPQNTPITWDDAEMFAIRKADLVLRPTVTSSIVTKDNKLSSYIDKWYVCPVRQSTSDDCRLSEGFGNKWVPNVRKFDPKYREPKYKQFLKLAKESYMFLEYYQKIKEILNTPSSDYTRFSRDEEDRSFIIKLRSSNDIQTNPLKAILYTYDYEAPVTLNDVRNNIQATRDLMEQTHLDIEKKYKGDKQGRLARGGRKSRRKKNIKSKRRKTRK